MSHPEDSESERIARLWRAVFQPAADIRAIPLPSEPLADSPEIFCRKTALCLAWLAHAAYVRDTGRRNALIGDVGWREIAHGGTLELHWSLVCPSGHPSTQYLAFRGTSDIRHWACNVNTLLSRWPEGGKVHGGFARAYRRLAPGLYKALGESPPTTLHLAGHSLGGALALLASTELSPDTVYTFGCPRPGNPGFAERAEAIPVYRVVHDQDLVTTLPYTTELLNDFAYKHVGQPVHLLPDRAPLIGEANHLPHLGKSWRQGLHALVEGDYPGEPLPALYDHAPSQYVAALRESTDAP